MSNDATIRHHGRRTAKRRGEAAEAAFLAKASSLGFEVAKPWGDSAPFDFLLHTGPRCWRVQVKSAREHCNHRYGVKASGDRVPYTPENIDFLVAYIVPEDAWYVIPIEAIAGRAGLWFYPQPGSRSRFERFREAWCLMACLKDGACQTDITVRRACDAASCPFAGNLSDPPTRRNITKKDRDPR